MIYFIQDTGTGYHKIGYTSTANPKERLSACQTGNPNKLVLIGTIKGSREDEVRLHNKYFNRNIRNEWFRLTEDEVKYIILENRGMFITKENLLKDSSDKKEEYHQSDVSLTDKRFFSMPSSLITDTNEDGKTRLAEIGAYGLAVLVCLRCSADFDTGLVSIGQREIARQTGMRQQTAGEYLAKLIELGYVSKVNSDGKRGLYKLT